MKYKLTRQIQKADGKCWFSSEETVDIEPLPEAIDPVEKVAKWLSTPRITNNVWHDADIDRAKALIAAGLDPDRLDR